MAFITLDRKIFNHVLWTESRAKTKFEAWLDLIQLVSYKNDNKQLISGQLVRWDRGQFPISRSFLAVRWSWSENKVRSFINLLKNDQMIILNSTGKNTILTLCNYEYYNITPPDERPDDDRMGDQVKDQQTTRSRTRIKQSKYIKEGKEVLMSDLLESDDHYEKIAYSFWTLFKEKLLEYNINSTDLSKAKAKNWINPVRLMFEVDKRSDDELREVFQFLRDEKPRSSGFAWSKNIRSAESLRSQFEKLLTEARVLQKIGNNGRTNSKIQPATDLEVGTILLDTFGSR